MPLRFGLVVVGVLLGLACSDAMQPSRADPDIGVIDLYGMRSDVLIAPETARAGEQISVSVRTFGNACVTAVRADVRYRGRTAIITPYDNLGPYGAEVACPDVLKRPEHIVRVRFDVVGVVTLRVDGRQLPSGAITSVERHILIAPR